MHHVKLFLIASLLGMSLVQLPQAFADEVLDAAQEAIGLYNEGKYSEAAGNFEYAGQLARQKRSGELSDYLPKPLSGWQAGEAESQGMGAAMFGGLTSIERVYTKGDASVTVNIMADSPMIQGVIMMLQNPMMAAASDGKIIKVGTRKGMFDYDVDNKSGQVQLVVANRYLIEVSGSNVTQEDILAYAGGVDYDGLEKK